MPYIFVSYSHKNKEDAFHIINQLHADGFRVWYDDHIRPGKEWNDNIATHIKNCGLFIMLISSEYLKSSYCLDEMYHARNLEKPMIPIYLEDVMLPEGIQMRFSRIQNIRKFEFIEQKRFYSKLYSSQGFETFKYDSINLNPVVNTGVVSDRPNYCAQYRLIFVVDISGDMNELDYRYLNKGLFKVKNIIGEKLGVHLDVDILQYNLYPRWKTLDELPLESKESANISDMLNALRDYGNHIPEDTSCIIVFINNGQRTRCRRDQYENSWRVLQKEKWYINSLKTGVVTRQYGDTEMLANIIGDNCAVVYLDDDEIQILPSLLERISVSSVRAVEINSTNKSFIDGRNIIDWLDNENLNEKVKWEIQEDGTLDILSGAIISDFSRPVPQTPWKEYKDNVKRIILRQGLRIIGMNAFYNMPLLEEVEIPLSVTDIRTGAFAKCRKLKKLRLRRLPFEFNGLKSKKALYSNSTIIWPGAFEDSPCENDISRQANDYDRLANLYDITGRFPRVSMDKWR